MQSAKRKAQSCRLLTKRFGGAEFRNFSLFTFHSQLTRRQGGFTAIEMVVVVGIIAIISSIILVRFSVFSGSIHLQRSSRETALLVRRAQNMALSVRWVPGVSAARSFGVHIDRRTTPVTAILFGDLSLPANGTYEASEDVAIDTRVVSGVTTTALIDQSVHVTEIRCSTPDHCTDTLDVSFSVPEARMSIYGNDPGGEQSGEITFSATGSAYMRKVVVRASGQIFVR